MHKQIIAIVLASMLIALSAEASYTAEVGCITVSEFDEIEKLGDNLTDQVAILDQVELMNMVIEPMNSNQAKPFEEALLWRRWGRLTRRWRGSWPSS